MLSALVLCLLLPSIYAFHRINSLSSPCVILNARQRQRRVIRTTRNLRSSRLQVVAGAPIEAIEGGSYAFIGGTVGVMSVMMMLEIQRANDISTEACPYW